MSQFFQSATRLTLPVVVLGGVASFPAIPINFELEDEPAVQAAEAGNDMIMPGMPTDRSAIRKAALSGELDPKDLRRCSARVVKLLLESEQGKERLREWKLDRKG